MSLPALLIIFIVITGLYGLFETRTAPIYRAWAPLGFFLLFTLALLISGHLRG
jgi:hypothetical protein